MSVRTGVHARRVLGLLAIASLLFAPSGATTVDAQQPPDPQPEAETVPPTSDGEPAPPTSLPADDQSGVPTSDVPTDGGAAEVPTSDVPTSVDEQTDPGPTTDEEGDPGPTVDEAATGDVVDEEPIAGEAKPPPDIAAADDGDQLVVAQLIPDPGPGQAVVSVKVGGDRTGVAGVTPLSGVTLQLYEGGTTGPTVPVNQPWSTCISDADGDCNFVVPGTQPGGVNRNEQFWVVETGVPAGWYANPQLLTGTTNSNGATTYAFLTPQVQAGDTFLSTVDFMVATGGTNNVASGGIWQNSRVNPALPAECGLDVALIVDVSGSVGGSLAQLQTAATTLTNSLVGTPSRLSLFTFASVAPANTTNNANLDTLQPISTQAGADVVNARINGLTAGGGTNWDRGLAQVAASPNAFDVALFITDGSPTFYGTQPEGPGNRTRFRETENGIFSANAIKVESTRVIAFGVGAGVGSAGAGLNLRAVSGPTLNSDYFQTTDYTQAGDLLRAAALQSCAGAVTVIKQVIPPGGTIADAVPDGGWEFAATSPTAAVIPPTGTTASGTGAVSFDVDFPVGQAAAQVEFTETQQAGYSVVRNGDGNNATCVRLDTGGLAPGYGNGSTPEQFQVSASANFPVSCTVYNLAPNPPATLTVDKSWSISSNGDVTEYQQGQQPPGIDAEFLLDSVGTAWGSTTTGLSSGSTVELDENILPLPTGCELTGTTVEDATGTVVSGGLPYSPTLQAGTNEFEVVNTISCLTELTLIKSVANGSEPATNWTLEALLPANPPPNAFDGPSGPTGVVGLVTPSVTYDLVETGDPNYVQFVAENAVINPPRTGSWSCVEVDENGVVIPGYSDGLNGGVTVPLGLFVRCTAVNRTAELTLIKNVDSPYGGTAAPDDWELTATPVAPPAGVTAQTVTGSELGETVNVRPGLTYDLTETDVAGYELDAIECVTNPDELEPPDTWAWVVVPSQSIDIAALSFDSDLEHIFCRFNNVETPPPYQILVTPGAATNRLTDDHEYQIELRTDSDRDGAVDDPVVGVDVALTWTGTAGSGIELVNGVAPPGAPTSVATCTTLPPISPFIGGACIVQVNSPIDVGSGVLTASFDIPFGTAGEPDLPTPDPGTTCTNPTIVGGVITQCNAVQLVQRIEASGNKTWVGYLVDVEADATNPVGIEHTFTIDVQRTDGTTSTPADGVTVNFTWTGPAGSSVTDVNGVPAPGAVDCITDANGQCTVTVESTDFGAGTLAVTSVNGDLIGAGPRTETPTPGSDLTATKTWVDWRVIMTPPTATNAVDQDHVFTVALERNDGSGWVAEDAGKEIFVTWTGPAGSAITAVSAGAVTDPSSAVCLTGAGGECTVTVSSPTNGTGTLTAFEVAVSIPGYAPPGGAAGDPFDFDIGDVSATKTWVVIRGTVSPPAATNLVGDPHQFTVLIETNGDAGWVPAPAGTTVTFSWVGAGGVTAVDAPGPDATSCTLRADGTCAVIVDSGSSGAGTFSIGDVTSLIVDGTQLVPAGGSLPVEDADASPAQDSRVGTKQWIEFQGDAQTTATNLAGDEHVFTLTGTYDNGGGETALPDGSTITFTWTGDGQVTETNGNPDVDATSCSTTVGSCTVTVSSATSGSGTIEIESIAADIDGTPLTGVSTTTPPSLVATAGGSLTATKTWLELTADVSPSATNLAGDDHVFTLTASYDDGSGPAPVPDGSTIDYTWTGTTPANPAASCLTTAGACTVTVSSATAGSGTITIDTVTTTVGGSTFTDVVPAAATGGSLTATKTWIELFADVAATATNLAGDDHVFTITATYDDGSGVVALPDGSTVAYTWTGATPADPASSCVIGTGTCEVTVSSTDPGSGTITIDSVTTTIGGETFTDVVPAAAAGGSLSATKTWVVFAAQVSPSATNLAGDDHVFTVTATVDDGSGPVAVPDGSTIEYLWAGAGTALPPTACATTGGSCAVTVSSGVAGTGTLTITAVSADIGGDVLLDTNVAAIAGGSLTATKTWVELFADVQATATNLAGDDHVFTITATYDEGAGSVAVPDGSTVAFTWTGATPADPVSSCVIAAGSCEVTVSSAVAGSGTLTVDSVTATINGATFTDVVPASAAGGSLSATKTWVELFADVQATATNLAGDDHVFTITATYDDGSGAAAVPDGSTVDFTWTGATPADPVSSCVIGAGSCEVTVSSTDPGAGTITIDSVTTTIGGETFTDVVPAAAAGGSLTATKTWVELFADVGVTATNVVGDDHVFTITATYDDGAGLVAVPDGSTVSYSWSGATPADPAASCVIVAGSCEVTVSSADPGSGTITVETVTATINGTDFTDVVPAAALGGSLTATKTWIDFRADVAVTATNLSGDDHVFTLTAVYDDGSGPQPADGASFAYTWTGTGTAAPPTPCAAAADANTCEVTVSSADPGTGTITIDSVTATVDGTTFTDVAAVATQGGAVTASKTWIAFDVDITPLTALNLVSQPHTFTISVQVDDGGGLVPLPIPPNSGTVDWTFDAPDGTTPSGTCTLEAGGTCTVVQNSNVAGTGTLTATSLTVNYDGVDFGPIDLTAAGSGQSQNLTVPPTATKGWAGYTLTLDPPTAVNLWPAEPDHVVTLTLATVPPASGLPVVGQDIDVTLTSSVATITGVSDGTFTPTTAVCTTDAAATCEVTVTSTGPGAATLSAVYEAMVGGVQVPVPGVDDAEKTWSTYRVRVTPTADENLLGSPHTFTVTVERSDNGSTWTPVQGAVPTLAVSSPGSISSQTCSAGTSAAGTCTAVVTSPSTGTATLTATYEGTIDGASADFEGDGDKTWIDYRVTVTPSTAENLVETNHVLTVTVEIDRGSGFVPLVGAEPAVVATGVGQITGNTCTAGTTTNGTCRATIRSTQPGTTTVTASFEGAAAGGETDTFSDSGTKSWIDYRLTLDPKSATNNVGEPHTFVATLEVDDGTGFSPAAGETLGFSVSGVGSISSIQPAGPAGGACTTDAAGECRITVNSPTAGSLTITVTFQAQAGPTEQTFTFDAQKSWIGGGIPNTGADSRRLVQIAAGMTLAGLLLLLAARRRRTRSADATA